MASVLSPEAAKASHSVCTVAVVPSAKESDFRKIARADAKRF